MRRERGSGLLPASSRRDTSYKAETLTMLVVAELGMFVAWPGLPGPGLLSPSGVSAGGVGMLMMAVVIWAALQFGLSPSSDFMLRLERLVVREGCSLHWMWMVLSSCMLRRRVAGTLELGRCVVFLLRREQQDVVSPRWLDREGLRDEG